MSLALQAQSMGLVSRDVGFHHEAVAELVNMPSNMSARAMIAIGYPGDSEDLPEKYRGRSFLVRGSLWNPWCFRAVWIDFSYLDHVRLSSGTIRGDAHDLCC